MNGPSDEKFLIAPLQDIDQMIACLPLLHHLYAQLRPTEYAAMLQQMTAQGYRQVAIFDGKEPIALSGYWLNTKLYCGRYIEMDNVIVHPAYRSAGLGKMLCDWITAKGKAEGCNVVMLDAYVSNTGAHRFYHREGFSIAGFHFHKWLKKH